MEKKKVSKQKMTIDQLAVLVKQGFKRTQDQMGKNQEEMAVMVNKAVQGTQDVIMGEIRIAKGEIGALRTEMKSGFEATTTQINNISRNIVDVVHQEDFDKLKDKIVDVEEVLNLKLKKA